MGKIGRIRCDHRARFCEGGNMESIYSITFKPNKIWYGQDFRYHCGIPPGIRFAIDKIWEKKGFWLKAPGYGGKPYGNGRIFVPYKQ